MKSDGFVIAGHDLNLRPRVINCYRFLYPLHRNVFRTFVGPGIVQNPEFISSYSMTVFSNLWQVMGRGKMPKIRSTRNASNGLCLHIGGDVLTPHCMNQTERALGLCSSDVLPDQYPIAAFGKMTISSGKSIIKKQATRKIITYGMTALYITLVSTPGGATPCK